MSLLQATESDFWIKSDALSISLNALGHPDYIQSSVISGTVIMVYIAGIIDYDAGHNYRRWKLQTAPTAFRTTDAKYVYARIPRSDTDTTALIIFSDLKTDLYGCPYGTPSEGNPDVPDPDYWYIYLGSISSSLGGHDRQWQEGPFLGTLSTDQNIREEVAGEWSRMFALDKVRNMIKVLLPMVSAHIHELFIGPKKKQVTDVKRSTDDDMDVPISDTAIATSGYVDKNFLHSRKADTAKEIITFEKGAKFGNFQQGVSGAAEWRDEQGNWHHETDYINVRKKLTMREVEIQEVTHIGGQQAMSAAQMTCSVVRDFGTFFRCYFLKKDDSGKAVTNKWKTGDQAFTNTFNLERQEDGTLGNHYLWRVVTGTSNDAGATDAQYGADYHWIDLSNRETEPSFADPISGFNRGFDTGSDAPDVGDKIVQLGNRLNEDGRTSAIISAGAGAGSPYIREFSGITTFSLEGTMETQIKPGDNIFTGRVHITKGSTGAGQFTDLPDEVMKAVGVGGENLLLNTGFTGDYESVEMSRIKVLEPDTSLYSPFMKFWDGTGISQAQTLAVSGREVLLGEISQTVSLIKGEHYVISFVTSGPLAVEIGTEREELTDLTAFQEVSPGRFRVEMKFVSAAVSNRFSLSGNNVSVYDLKLERGTLATDWCPARSDNDPSSDRFRSLWYLQQAIREGGVDVLGGLFLASVLNLGNPEGGHIKDVTAGISGIFTQPDDISFWSGGTLAEAIRTMQKVKSGETLSMDEWKSLVGFCATHGGDVFFKGFIYAMGGYFRGTVHATAGEFRGTVHATAGVFRGTVHATDGEFKGTIFADDGYFSGFVKKRRKVIGISNVWEYVSSISSEESFDGVLDFDKCGSFVEFVGPGWGSLRDPGNLNLYLLGLYPDMDFGSFDNIPEVVKEEARSYVGTKLMIYNSATDGLRINLSGTISEGGKNEYGAPVFIQGSKGIGYQYFICLECKMGAFQKYSNRDVFHEYIWWEVIAYGKMV